MNVNRTGMRMKHEVLLTPQRTAKTNRPVAVQIVYQISPVLFQGGFSDVNVVVLVSFI